LEGNDLNLELAVELPQCLLVTDEIFTIESRLLPIAIRLGLLLIHLLLHVDEYLKEFVFMLLRWLDTSGCLLRKRAGVLGDMRLIDGWWGIVPPVVLMALLLVVVPLRMMACGCLLR